MSWWSQATTAQKLAQIDGGIECGMTAPQVAMAARTSLGNIRFVARYHGRHFPASNQGASASSRRMQKTSRDRAAYLRGDRVDLWGNTEPQDEFALDEREGA